MAGLLDLPNELLYEILGYCEWDFLREHRTPSENASDRTVSDYPSELNSPSEAESSPEEDEEDEVDATSEEDTSSEVHSSAKSTSSSERDKPSLLNIALTCRTLQPVATSVIFKDISLSWSREEGALLQRSFQENASLKTAVRRCDILTSSSEDILTPVEFLEFQNLRSVHISDGKSLDDVLARFPGLKSVQVWRDWNPGNGTQTVVRLPTLKKLEIRLCNKDVTSTWTESPISTLKLVDEYDDRFETYRRPAPFYAEFLSHFPRLQTLHFKATKYHDGMVINFGVALQPVSHSLEDLTLDSGRNSRGYRDISVISGLQGLTALTKLNINYEVLFGLSGLDDALSTSLSYETYKRLPPTLKNLTIVVSKSSIIFSFLPSSDTIQSPCPTEFVQSYRRRTIAMGPSKDPKLSTALFHYSPLDIEEGWSAWLRDMAKNKKEFLPSLSVITLVAAKNYRTTCEFPRLAEKFTWMPMEGLMADAEEVGLDIRACINRSW